MRILVLAIGNTSLFGGVYSGARLATSFRLPNTALVDLPQHVRGTIDRAALCSVVPAETPDALRFIRRTWNLDTQLLTSDAPHGLTLGYRQPRQLGSDRIAAAVGARALYPDRNVIVVDCGTATTVTALSADGTLVGGAILPGLALWPEMLALRTAQLPRIKLRRPRVALGRSTEDGIASGVFFGHIGAIRETVARVQAEAFGRAKCTVVGTGGHALRFSREKLFTATEPTLILRGLREFADQPSR
jgi:type III pantothenate kinase